MLERREIGVHGAAAGLFVLGALFAALTAIGLPFTVTFDGRFEALNAAKALAETGTLADPFAPGATGPTAHVAPVFPAVAALLRWLPFEWTHALIGLGILLCGLNAAAMPYASQALWGELRPGMIAGVFSALGLRFLPQHDTVLSSLLAVIACFALARGSRVAGWWTGLAVLANPVNLLGLGPLAWWAPDRRMLRAAVLGVMVICLPWVARNWVQLGSPAPVRGNFGMELALANNDCARAGVGDAIECFTSHHPGWSEAEFEGVRELGEARYNRVKLEQGLGWMAQHPGRAAGLVVARARRYFLPGLVADGHTAPMICIVTLIGLAGLITGKIGWSNPLTIAAALSWLPYLFLQVQTDPRYRSYSLWIWCLIAGFVVNAFRNQREGKAAVQAGVRAS